MVDAGDIMASQLLLCVRLGLTGLVLAGSIEDTSAVPLYTNTSPGLLVGNDHTVVGRTRHLPNSTKRAFNNYANGSTGKLYLIRHSDKGKDPFQNKKNGEVLNKQNITDSSTDKFVSSSEMIQFHRSPGELSKHRFISDKIVVFTTKIVTGYLMSELGRKATKVSTKIMIKLRDLLRL